MIEDLDLLPDGAAGEDPATTVDAVAARIAAAAARGPEGTPAAVADPVADPAGDPSVSDGSAAGAIRVEIDGTARMVPVGELVRAWQEAREGARGVRGERGALRAERRALAQALGGLERALIASLPADASGADVKTTREAAARLRQTVAALIARDRAEAQHQTLRAIESGRTRLPELIPEWRDEATMRREAGAIRTMLADAGFGADEIASLVDPRAVALLRDAWRWKQAEAAKPGLRRKAAEAPSLRPGAVERAEGGRREQDLSQRLRRSGRIEDAAALFRHRMGA